MDPRSTEIKAIVDINVKPKDEKELNAYLSLVESYLITKKQISFEHLLYITEKSSSFEKSFTNWLNLLIAQRDKSISIDAFISAIPKTFDAYKAFLTPDECEFINNPTGRKEFQEKCENIIQKAQRIASLDQLIRILQICFQLLQEIEAVPCKFALISKEKTLPKIKCLIQNICENYLIPACDVFAKSVDSLACQKISPRYNYEILLKAVNEGNLSVVIFPPKIKIYKNFIHWLYDDLYDSLKCAFTTAQLEEEKPFSEVEDYIKSHFANELFLARYLNANNKTYDPDDKRLDTGDEPLLYSRLPTQLPNFLSYDERIAVRDAVINKLPSCAVASELQDLLPGCYKRAEILQLLPLDADVKKIILNSTASVVQQIEQTLARAGRYTPPYLKFTLCGFPKQLEHKTETKHTQTRSKP